MGSNGWGVRMRFGVCHVREAEWGPYSLGKGRVLCAWQVDVSSWVRLERFLVFWGWFLNRRVVRPVTFRNGKSEGGGVAAVKSQIDSGRFCFLEALGLVLELMRQGYISFVKPENKIMGIHFAMSEDGEGTWQRAPLRRLGEYIPSGVGYLAWSYWILYHNNMIYGTVDNFVQS
jgi:hypothetical protein